MRQFYYDNIAKLASASFDKFKVTLETFSSQQQIIIALSGGSSVDPLYQEIAKRYSEIPSSLWEKVIFCFADERLVPLDSPDSNYKAACDSFLNALIAAQVINAEAIATVNFTSNAADIEYTEKVGNKINIALLGAGPDSHTCSLFPEHSSINNPSEDFILVENSPKPPARRISMSRAMVENTDHVFVFLVGEGKRDAYNNFMDDSVKAENAPIKTALKAYECSVFSDLKKD